jgi:hypothetical protein
MDLLISVFNFYDKTLSGLPANAQFFIALLLIALICWSFYSIFAHGHWIFIIIFVILFPGAWPALKSIGTITWAAIKFLIVRIQINL